ncbi:MAG: prepilin-type N-terminal cleavage/methylation domain-containing protein, partial [Planococcus donghaensis]
MKRLIKNERGISLVEILAAVVILGIVLVSVMTFFTQSAKFTASNHETLTAVQVGEEVVAKVRGVKSLTELTVSPEKFTGNATKVTSTTLHPEFSITVEKTQGVVTSKLQKVKITVLS